MIAICCGKVSQPSNKPQIHKHSLDRVFDGWLINLDSIVDQDSYACILLYLQLHQESLRVIERIFWPIESGPGNAKRQLLQWKVCLPEMFNINTFIYNY